MTNSARATLAAVETFHDGEAMARISAAAAEVYQTGDPAARVTLAAVEAFHAGGPGSRAARVSLAGVEVWRSIAERPWPVFPVRLFCPPSLRASIVGAAESGGVTLTGEAALEALSAGGKWVMEFGEAPLWDVDMVVTWRRFVAGADLGVTPVIVPFWDRINQPFADPKLTTPTPFGLDVYTAGVWDWHEDLVHARLSADEAAHAREISFSFAGAARPTGGEHFSIMAGRYAWRLYRIVRVVDDTAGVVTAEIRPPLREFSPQRTRLNFDSPRCTMRPDGDIEADVELLRFGKGTARFVESDARYP